MSDILDAARRPVTAPAEPVADSRKADRAKSRRSIAIRSTPAVSFNSSNGKVTRRADEMDDYTSPDGPGQETWRGRKPLA